MQEVGGSQLMGPYGIHMERIASKMGPNWAQHCVSADVVVTGIACASLREIGVCTAMRVGLALHMCLDRACSGVRAVMLRRWRM